MDHEQRLLLAVWQDGESAGDGLDGALGALHELAARGCDWHIDRCATLDELTSSDPAPDAILLDCAAASLEALLARLPELFADPPAIIAISRGVDYAEQRELLDRGATDFIPADELTPVLLERTLRYAVQRNRIERETRWLEQHEPRTGLATANLFRRQLEHAIQVARRHQRRAAVLCIRIDNFEDILDVFGSSAVEELCTTAGTRLSDTLRRSDLIAHPASGEFLVMLEHVTTIQEAAATAEKVRRAFARRFELERSEAYLTASIGIAIYPRCGTDADALLDAAREAARQVIEEGGDDFRLFDSSLVEVSRQRTQMEVALPQALARDEFSVCYQPQVDIATGEITGAEALLRWSGLEIGDVNPEMFIPVAEETGAIVRIGEWVLRRACQQASEWIERDWTAVRIAINVSGHQFHEGRIIADLERLLGETPIDPANIELELTERVFVQNIREHRAVFDTLRDIGIRIALDDFGVGYSSLSYLKSFPVDAIKIDRTFVSGLPERQDDAAIVRAVVAMAHNLGVRVVAEGVETPEQHDFLRGIGCDEAQGYLFSAPVRADAFLELLRDRRVLLPGATRAADGSLARSGDS